MDTVARVLVQREFDCVESFGGRYHWSDVCQQLHTSLLATFGPLRPVFEPHRDTFILLIHSIAFGLQVANNGEELPRQDRRDYGAWLAEMFEQLGETLLRELLGEMDRGLYVTPLRPLTPVPVDYDQQLHMNTTIVLEIMNGFKKRRKVGAKAVLHRLKAKIWPRQLVRRLSNNMSPRRLR